MEQGATFNEREGGHLDRLLDICHARGLPLLTAICVNQEGLRDGRLSPEALAGFVKGVRRLGYQALTSEAETFLRKCQQECLEWGSPSCDELMVLNL